MTILKLLRRSWLYFFVALLLLAVIVALGPRVPIDTTLREVELPDDLDSYLASSESAVIGLRPDVEKRITWADPTTKQQTPIAIVYLHGFSSSRRESAPLSATLAEGLNANLFETRLTGHGLDGEALAQATVNDWLSDGHEALAIGRRLGERIIVVGASTGATVATWLAAQPNNDDIVALLFISPNYRPKNAASEIMLWPWGRQIGPLLGGSTRTREPFNEIEPCCWTLTYPTTAILPVMGMVQLIRDTDVSQIDTPLFIAYSPQDQVVEPTITTALFEQFSSAPKRLFVVEDSVDPFNHVIAGDIRSPNTTDRIATQMLEFVQPLVAE